MKLLRHPTYSNGKVAFSYLGDLWIANENQLRRAAAHRQPARRDVFRAHSLPTASWIALSPLIEKATDDVCVIPAASGGKPRQLTFHSAGRQAW